MLKEEGRVIKNNPLRILGVYSDTPKKEIVANLGKLRAFAKTGKTLSFDSDLTSLLGPINRTKETIEKANNDISLPKDKLQAGMFWFMQHTDNDKAAMECLKNGGDPNEALTIIQKKGNYSGIINMAVLSLVLKRWDLTLYSYAYLLESDVRRGALVKAFTDTEDYFSEDDLVEFVSSKLINDFPSAHWLDQLQHEEVELGDKTYPFKSRFPESKLLIYLTKKCVSKVKKEIDVTLEKASAVSQSDAKANLGMAELVETKCKALLKELRLALGKSNKDYVEYADNVANQILDNCIDYYTHDGENPKRARNVIKYTRYAYRTAESKTAKERAKKNLDILNETLENQIPESIEEEYNSIDKMVMNYQEKSKIGNCSFLLGPIIEDAYKNILTIKNKVGRDNKHYLSISTNFVYFAFQEIVKKINADSNYRTEAERNAYITNLNWARSLFDTLAKFDKDEECKMEFNKNFSSLMELLQKIKPVHPQSKVTQVPPRQHQVSTQTNGRTSPYSRAYNDDPYRKSPKESNDNSIKYIFFGVTLIAIVIMIVMLGVNSNKNKIESTPTESAYNSEYNQSYTNESETEQNSYRNPSGSIYKQEENTSSEPESYSDNSESVETFTTISYSTGDRPYQSTYGKGRYDYDTDNSLLIRNGSSTDAVVFLERLNGKKVRHVYIRKGDNFNMTNIPGGQYIIKVMQGTDWNPDKDNGNGNPKGGFMYSCSISKSETYDPFDYPYPSSGRYSQGEVTLYKVQNGNMQTEAINENELF